MVGLVDSNGQMVASYTYDAYGNLTSTLDPGIESLNPFRYRSYYYDSETSLYYCNSRYYNPEWGRYLNSADASELVSTGANGINLYNYSVNNPVMVNAYTERVAKVYGTSVAGSAVSNGRGNSDGSTINDNEFKIFSAQLRISTGWQTDTGMISGWLGRVGFSWYTTTTKGDSGLFCAFAGQTTDVTNIFGSTYYAGVGINAWNVVGLEIQLEAVGLGLSISVFDYSVSMNVNVLGSTSLTLAQTKQISEGVTKTKGVTIGANTGLAIYTAYWVYKLYTTGDPSWDYKPAY